MQTHEEKCTIESKEISKFSFEKKKIAMLSSFSAPSGMLYEN
jgi:hypothetical protein